VLRLFPGVISFLVALMVLLGCYVVHDTLKSVLVF